MTDITSITALAIAAQSAPGTFETPSDTTDVVPVANCNHTPQAITAENPEYRGSIHRPGPVVLGATYDITFELMLRGPGGADVPAADAFIQGRVLRALGFTENRVTAAIPVAAEAVGGAGNTTDIAALSTGATATDDLYTGLAIQLASLGTIGQPASLAMIHDYVGTGKLAHIAQTAGSAYSGNYQIPKQLAYTLAATGTPPLLSFSHWQGSRRFDFVDMAPSRATLTLNTAARTAADYGRVAVTFTGELHDYEDDAAPSVETTVAIPPYRDGKLHVDGLALGGSSVSIDLSPRVGFPPNPNRPNGVDPAQLVETRRSVTLRLNRVAKATKDFIAHAQAQDFHHLQAIYGLASGNYIGVGLGGIRFNFPNPDTGGDFFADTIEGYIDSAEKSVSLTFPYYA